MNTLALTFATENAAQPDLPRQWARLSLALACSVCAAALWALPAQAGSNRILPGRSIGEIHLGPHGQADLAKLPEANGTDAGMSKTEWVWRSPNGIDTLYVHAIANGALDVQPLAGCTIDAIRVTSPWFRTPEGLSTGDRRDRILRRYPNARPVEDDPNLYDDDGQGIAFEFAGAASGSRCAAIMVHPPGRMRAVTAQRVEELLR